MVKIKKSVKGASKVRENEERRIRQEMEALHADESERREQEAARQI